MARSRQHTGYGFLALVSLRLDFNSLTVGRGIIQSWPHEHKSISHLQGHI